MENYQKNLNFAKELKLDINYLNLWEKISSILPYNKEIFSFGKNLGS